MHRSSHTLAKNKCEGRVGGSSRGPVVVRHFHVGSAFVDAWSQEWEAMLVSVGSSNKLDSTLSTD